MAKAQTGNMILYQDNFMNDQVPGFNGERLDPISGMAHLGMGYRAYNPVLCRFNAPDAFSPFGAGGVNSYAFCAGDPVNHADPSGHLSWQALLGIGMGILGLAMAVFTAGTSIAAAGSLMTAVESASALSLLTGVAGVMSDVAAIASGAAEGNNPQASATLGWVSLGLGIVGMIKGVSGLPGRGSRPFSSLMMGRRNMVQGTFRNPRYLGLTTDNLRRFDFLYEDTTPNGLRRLNIVTQGGVQFGTDPTLAVRLWNNETRLNEAVHFPPDIGEASPLDNWLTDETGHSYPVYRIGASHAANLYSPIAMGGRSRGTRSFAIKLSARLAYSRIELSRGNVYFRGDAWEDLSVAIGMVRQRGAPLDSVHGQMIMDVTAAIWQQQVGALRMESDEWVTYLNGRIAS